MSSGGDKTCLVTHSIVSSFTIFSPHTYSPLEPSRSLRLRSQLWQRRTLIWKTQPEHRQTASQPDRQTDRQTDNSNVYQRHMPFEWISFFTLNVFHTLFWINVSKGAKIRNRYNQAPHLTQDTNGKVTNSQQTPQTRAKRPALSQQVTTKHI